MSNAAEAAAQSLYQQGKFEEASAEFERARQLGSTPTILRMLGLSLALSGQVDIGIGRIQEAIHANPTDLDSQYALAYALMVAGRHREASEVCDRILSVSTHHAQAKFLLIASLSAASDDASLDPITATSFLERAHKLDRDNAQVTVKLLRRLNESNQKGKAKTVLGSLTMDQLRTPELTQFLEAAKDDPVFASSVQTLQHQLQRAPATARPTPTPAPSATPGMKACPNCKNSILASAPLCPYCKTPLQGGVKGKSRADMIKTPWQTIAYTILCWLWILVGLLQIAVAVFYSGSNLITFDVILGLSRIGVAIGLLVRNEWIAMVAKIYIYLSMGGAGCLCGMGMLAGGLGLLVVAFSLLQLLLSGFMLYLINFEND